MTQRILIVPGGHFQIPAIRAAKRRGLTVVVADKSGQSAGASLADIFEIADPSDPAALMEVAQRHRVDGILGIASDPCVISTAVVADAMKLPGLSVDVAKCARNKYASLRRIREAAPAYCPRFVELPSIEDGPAAMDEIGLPLVLKPQAANGSKGVVIVERREDFVDWYMYARTFAGDRPLVAEERLIGAEFSVETWSVDGEVHVLAVVDKRTTPPPYCVEVGHTTPSRFPAPEVEQLREAATAIVKALGIENGPAHNELFLTPEGPKFVETGARLAGGCIASHLVPLATGVNLIEASIDAALNQRPHVAAKFEQAAAIRFFQPTPGVVRAVEGLDDAEATPNVVEVLCTIRAGGTVHPLQNSDHRVGYVIAQGLTPDEAAYAAETALAKVSFEIEDR